MMKAISVQEFGAASNLNYINCERPPLGERQVRIRIHYAGVNPVDRLIRQGGYGFFEPDLPYTPGFDGAGDIIEVGQEVKDLKVGDRVFGAALINNATSGSYAEEWVVDACAVQALPSFMSYEEGAALGLNALAAHRALFEVGALTKEDTVMIHGASGGVGTVAIQLAKAQGAQVIGTASLPEDRALLESLGADLTTPHVSKDNEAAETIKAFTHGKGPSLLIEMVGDKNLDTDLNLIRQGGRIVITGAGGDTTIAPRKIMGKEAIIKGMGVWYTTPSEQASMLREIKRLSEKKQLKGIVGDVYPLEDANESHEAIEAGRTSHGKTLLRVQ